MPHPVPICAEESVHTADDLQSPRERYDYVNVKLDKTGGLIEAIRLVEPAQTARRNACSTEGSIAPAAAFRKMSAQASQL